MPASPLKSAKSRMQTMIAMVNGPLHSTTNLSCAILWLWVHLLQFNVSNQIEGFEEDEKNKPDRPLPSGRISMQKALLLRWALVPTCFGYSALFSIAILHTSIAFVVLTVLYNELGAHKMNWIVRNIVNALGFGCFGLGASLVAGKCFLYSGRIG